MAIRIEKAGWWAKHGAGPGDGIGMNFPGIIWVLIGLGAGLASGSFFAPEIRQGIRSFEPARAENYPGVPASISHELAPATAPMNSGPVAEMGTILQEGDPYRRFGELIPYAESIRPEDLPGAIDKVMASHGPGREPLMNVLIGRWVAIDPEGALAAARKMGTHVEANGIFQSYYSGLTASDRSAAIAALRKLPEGLERSNAVWGVVSQIAPDDPASAAALFRSVRSFDFAYGNHFIYSEWAAKDIDQATEALLDNGNFASDSTRRDAVNGVVERLLKKEPATALNWIAQLPNGKVRDMAMMRATEQWSQTDPQSTMEWVQSFPASPVKDNALDHLMTQWASEDPRAGVAYGMTLPDGAAKTKLMAKSIEAWAQADGASAWTWAQSQPASDAATRAQLEVVMNWAKTDPAAAAARLQTVPQIQETKDENMARMFGGSWREPLEASRTPNSQAYAGVARAWATSSPAQAVAWLGQLPDGRSRDAAVEAYTEVVVKTDPRTAVEWANRIGDSSDRRIELRNLLFDWSR